MIFGVGRVTGYFVLNRIGADHFSILRSHGGCIDLLVIEGGHISTGPIFALVLKSRLLPRRKPLNLTRNIADPIAIKVGPRSPLGTFQVFLMRGLVRRGQARGRVLLLAGTTARG